MKALICLDFDGVIHSYTSGWRGPRCIPDPPVEGALPFIVKMLDHFKVAIYSSRSHRWFGRLAMQRWLRHHLTALAPVYELTPAWWLDRIQRTAFAEPTWMDEVDIAVSGVISEIMWPTYKPAALVTIDDRALTFNGDWPTLRELADFQPWNKRAPA